MQKNNSSKICFVGAGPGDPELITLKGMRLLEEADIVIYTGSLVPYLMVKDLKAEIYDSSGLDLVKITDLMVDAWNLGKKIVRLHTGDPSIYGAISEQMEVLAKFGIPFDVIPGVSSVTATAAALKKELTLPGVSQTIIITRLSGRTKVPEKEDLKSLASHRATMIVMLSVSMIESVVRELCEGGYPEETPAAVVEKASWSCERIIRGTLSTIADQVKAASIYRTAVIAVGDVLSDSPLSELSKLYDKNFAHGFREKDFYP